MGSAKWLSGPNSNHRLETAFYRPSDQKVIEKEVGDLSACASTHLRHEMGKNVVALKVCQKSAWYV